MLTAILQLSTYWLAIWTVVQRPIWMVLLSINNLQLLKHDVAWAILIHIAKSSIMLYFISTCWCWQWLCQQHTVIHMHTHLRKMCALTGSYTIIIMYLYRIIIYMCTLQSNYFQIQHLHTICQLNCHQKLESMACFLVFQSHIYCLLTQHDSPWLLQGNGFQFNFRSWTKV